MKTSNQTLASLTEKLTEYFKKIQRRPATIEKYTEVWQRLKIFMSSQKIKFYDKEMHGATCKVVCLIVPLFLQKSSGTCFSVNSSLLRRAWPVTAGCEARRTMYQKLESCLYHVVKHVRTGKLHSG
jgi:hypothetical protein